MKLLTDHIGKVIMCVEPDAYTSAALVPTTDRTDIMVPIKGLSSVLFILQVGDLTAASTLTASIMYSSTGQTSDATASSAIWASTNAAFTAVTSDGVNEVYLLELNLASKGLSDEGMLFVQAALPAGANDWACVAIPIIGTGNLPVSQQNTVKVAT
jgi:hypothetical protein